jgi:hypothetical protein
MNMKLHEQQEKQTTERSWFCTLYFQLCRAERFYPETLKADGTIKAMHLSSTTSGVNMAAPLTTGTKVKQQCFDYCGLKM